EQQASGEPAAPVELVDPRKAAVEAAIARAKARKQAQQVSSEPAEPSPEPVDPRKAAIAAAIARAKAKKDAQQQVVNEE
ncbi:electron transport complex subunit RsxC, partial [Citrobacter amalonaticus]|nr:electron transport complex subunit RsxC [Citrobacter amalonaticus]